MESDEIMASTKKVEMTTKTRENRKHILYANFKILSFLKLKYGNAKNTLGRLDRELTKYISTKIGKIEGARPIRNYPDPKIIVRIHEINGGVKTGVCFKGKNCKCTELSEANEFPVQNTMLRTSRTGPQNKCSLKTCEIPQVDESINSAILKLNSTLSFSTTKLTPAEKLVRMMDIVHSRGRRNCGEYRLKVPESIAGKDCDFWNHLKGKNGEKIVESFCFLFWKYQDWLHFDCDNEILRVMRTERRCEAYSEKTVTLTVDENQTV
ncbi:unnamed protein product [Oikopleura dioica]|uniref:Uncharacterized protein n=1 Tax=Oikopleura dioica TaxID=34765 RepID=E4YL54_OIKDI|nr:unnamed protein product [Oikopleura dioica]